LRAVSGGYLRGVDRAHRLASPVNGCLMKHCARGGDVPSSKDDPDAVDEYLASLPDDERNALQELRKLIEATVPEVQERISYGTTVMFALKRDLVGLGAQKKHLSFFIMSPELAGAMQEQIEQTHRLSGATIHFNPDAPLPASLVKELLRARLKEEADRGA
jgi:uncharacterized protein YdhG (YjbR/CyaY superfamily)